MKEDIKKTVDTTDKDTQEVDLETLNDVNGGAMNPTPKRH